ncbi:MAG: hypothetical protein WBP54_03655 [Pelodictyon phaeoclathratiforme]
MKYGSRRESFLKELGKRWFESGTTPHEIGIVLGYPYLSASRIKKIRIPPLITSVSGSLQHSRQHIFQRPGE